MEPCANRIWIFDAVTCNTVSYIIVVSVDSLALYSCISLFSGGVAAEVGLKPAKLLDDPVPEASEHQTRHAAYAGVEGLPQASDGPHDQANAGVNLYLSGRKLVWRTSWSTCCANFPLSTFCPFWLITRSPKRLCAT